MKNLPARAFKQFIRKPGSTLLPHRINNFLPMKLFPLKSRVSEAVRSLKNKFFRQCFAAFAAQRAAICSAKQLLFHKIKDAFAHAKATVITMFETIYTIPINEAFDKSEQEGKGCPFCRLYEKFETDELDLILGGSMMEPDVRIKTNKQGFCRRHYEKLMQKKNRLGLALILESHLNELRKEMNAGLLDAVKGPGTGACSRIKELERSCYLCNRINFSFGKVMENAVLLWQKEPAFKKKVENQPCFCLPHYELYLRYGKQELNKKEFSAFYKQVSGPALSYFDALCEDVSWFCKKFDYRYDAEPWGNSKDSVERAVAFLSSPEGTPGKAGKAGKD